LRTILAPDDSALAERDRQALAEGCNAYRQASMGGYCRLFEMPMEMAPNAEGS
jgi:hypothetical protein